MSVRRIPQPGDEVRIEYLAATVSGYVQRIARDGREVEVVTESGQIATFALNPATARFTLGGGQAGARLRF